MLLAPLLLVLFFLPRLFDWLHTFGGNILSPLRVLAGVFSMRRWAWDWIERGFLDGWIGFKGSGFVWG